VRPINPVWPQRRATVPGVSQTQCADRPMEWCAWFVAQHLDQRLEFAQYEIADSGHPNHNAKWYHRGARFPRGPPFCKIFYQRATNFTSWNKSDQRRNTRSALGVLSAVVCVWNARIGRASYNNGSFDVSSELGFIMIVMSDLNAWPEMNMTDKCRAMQVQQSYRCHRCISALAC
jgi:hypothetical protein